MRARLGPLAAGTDAAVAELAAANAVRRAFDGDHTLWQDDPTEVADRLGWLVSPREMVDEIPSLEAFARDAVADGLAHTVLLGMGGSSLFPEVLVRTFGAAPGHLDLHVLDSTDPAAVRRAATQLPPEATLHVAASKSGTTIETTSHLALFWHRIGRPEQFAVVTDPGSPLADLARRHGFRRTFENRPDIGGRYSALSLFGLVPAALLGVDVARLLGSATAMLDAAAPDVPAGDNPAVLLGAAMGAAARAGRDKLTLVLPPAIASFGAWLEQLVAESTGKHGTGLLPVDGEPLGPPEVYGDDRLFVAVGEHPGLDALAAAGHPVVELPSAEPDDLGREVVRWELATALAGVLLGINPFDQPDVAAAKEATARVLRDGLPDIAEEPLETLLAGVRPGDYLAVHAYVDPGSEVVGRLEAVRRTLRDRLRVATTLGIGPRFLHSTGQLHKGGPPTGVFVQVVGADDSELPIPGQPYGFSTLKRAQAAGDLAALRDRGLRAARVPLHELLAVAP